jgi:hypothetical protein
MADWKLLEYHIPLPLLRSLDGCHLAHAQRLPLLGPCRILLGQQADPSYLQRDIGEPGLASVNSARWMNAHSQSTVWAVQVTCNVPLTLAQKRRQRTAR